MDLDRTTLGERAMVVAYTDLNSSKAKEIGMTLESEKGKVMRLSDYLISSRNMDFLKNLQKEAIDIEALNKVYVVFGSATKGELKGNGEIGLVINMGKESVFKNKSGNFYRDLGLITFDATSKSESFTLDSKIRDEQKSMLKGAVDPETTAEEFEIDTLDDLTEHITKKKNLCPRSKKEVRERTEKNGGEIDEEKFADSQEELEKRLIEQEKGKALLEGANIELTDDLKQQLAAMGVSVADIKQVTVVESPEVLSQYLGDEGNVAPTGKTYIIALQNREANIKGDRMVTLQDGKIGDARENDDKIRDFKLKYGKDSSVISKTDPEEEAISYKDATGKEQQELVIGEETSMMEYLEERLQEVQITLEEKLSELSTRTDLSPLERQQNETIIRGDAYAEVERLQQETGVSLPNISDQYLAEANHSVEQEEVEFAKQVGKGVLTTTAAALAMAIEANKLVEDDGFDELGRRIVPGSRTH